jgi:putative oxidoreductase
MSKLNTMISQLNKQESKAYAFIRIFIGIALLVRGWVLLNNPDGVTELIGQDNMHMWYSYITIAHLIGGLLLTVGIITRLAALIQIPILFSAVFLVHAKEGLMMGGQSLELAALVLFLLLVFFVFGSGDLSVTCWWRKRHAA